MKTLTTTLTILSALTLASASPSLHHRDDCSDPPLGSCTFYTTCLEKTYNCGPEGYPLGYGQHFCDLFVTNESQFSDEGKTWINDVMHCLQEDLVPYVTGQEDGATCDDVKTFAFGTHPQCYVDSGVCKLPVEDWFAIVKTVSLKELFASWDAFKATLQTGGECAEFLAWLVAQDLMD